jgi:plastocyanin
MMNQRNLAFRRVLLVLPLALLVGSAGAQSKKSKYTCDEPNPQSLCNPGNTCGSPTAPCNVDVKRTAYAASATPQIPGAKGNSLFCVRPGTTVNWTSSSKNTGFVVDVSDASPFDPCGAIIGGSNKDVSVVAKTSGCYKYSVGACVSGALNGMCANASAELIVTK